jgi:rhamnopyranosyl-N-acetylglucosaminyl-diphospho-decaprenol beta-1,3/1,4-galactofuranosyltransferase
MDVCAVVVTHNRRAMLVECLAALAEQTRLPDRILVVDNASTDGTAELLRAEYPNVELLSLATNAGGAGGFYEGLRRAHADGFDWIWLMDDDTIPTPTCLEALLDAGDRAPGGPPALLSSKAVWTDGRLHPMNYHGFERERTDEVVAAGELGLLPLRTATFVSLLVNRRAIDAHGLPLRRYFLWSDDIEYTARVLRHEPGYVVPGSVAVHKTKQPYTAISASGDRFYFHVRNSLYMLRGTAWAPREKPSLLFGFLVSLLEYLVFNRFSPRVMPIIGRGLRDGLRRGAPTPARP